MDNVVDKLDEAIKLYVTKLTRGSLDEREGHRAMEIISFTINLEHVGDIIDKNLGRARRQEDPAQAAVLRPKAPRSWLPSTSASWRASGSGFGVFMSGDVKRGAQADRRQGAAAQRRAGRRRAAPRAPARRTAGDAGDDVAASRRAARPEAHPLAHLLGGLSGAGSRRRNARRRRRRERPHPRRRGEPEADGAVGLAPRLPPPVAKALPSLLRAGRTERHGLSSLVATFNAATTSELSPMAVLGGGVCRAWGLSPPPGASSGLARLLNTPRR